MRQDGIHVTARDAILNTCSGPIKTHIKCIWFCFGHNSSQKVNVAEIHMRFVKCSPKDDKVSHFCDPYFMQIMIFFNYFLGVIPLPGVKYSWRVEMYFLCLLCTFVLFLCLMSCILCCWELLKELLRSCYRVVLVLMFQLI